MRKTAGNGSRRGENHPRAILSDREVALMREMHAEGGWSYTKLAEKFECSKSLVQHIITERKRIYG